MHIRFIMLRLRTSALPAHPRRCSDLPPGRLYSLCGQDDVCHDRLRRKPKSVCNAKTSSNYGHDNAVPVSYVTLRYVLLSFIPPCNFSAGELEVFVHKIPCRRKTNRQGQGPSLFIFSAFSLRKPSAPCKQPFERRVTLFNKRDFSFKKRMRPALNRGLHHSLHQLGWHNYLILITRPIIALP
jgi:hypothetical protein